MIPATFLGMTANQAVATAPLGEAWHDFYLMAGTASVTLVGLLFVALSLHVEILFKDRHQHFRELAAQAFQGYLYVLITSLTFLLPGTSVRMLAVIYSTINVAMIVRTFMRVPKYLAARRASGDRSRQGWRFFVPVIAYLLGLVAVAQWLTGNLEAGIGFFAPVVMMLAAATRTSWDLLEYVGRVRTGTQSPD